MKTWYSLLCVATLAAGCRPQNPLPILGPRELATRTVGGQTVADTVYHTIGEFAFQDQYGDSVTHATVAGKVYVADFFFVNCPSICPLTTQQMLRLYTKYRADDRVLLLSHTLAPEYDTTAVLNDFATRLGVQGPRWRFLRAGKYYTYQLAQQSYFTAALDDPTAPGGIEHSGLFTLVDTQRRIRGFYDGTDPKQIDRLLEDLERLLAEEFSKRR